MEGNDGKTSISFGFSKKTDKKLIQNTSLNETEIDNEEPDYVTSLEGRKVNSVKQKEEKKDLVIPLIKTNNWRTQAGNKTDTDRPPPGDGIDSQAVQEIINDTLKQNESWETRDKPDSNLHIPLLMQNAVPEGFETDDRLDVSLRPEEPEEADFDEVPIEAFGMAMLRGMGWKPGQGIGKNTKAVNPVEAVLRPKGMGLGADRKQAQNLNISKQGAEANKDQEGDLQFKKGTCCLIEKGPHRDLYGMIEGLDEDNARVMVKLTVSGKSVTVSQYNTHLVSKKEYDQYSKYLNKGSADRYKEKEQKKKEKSSRDRSRDREMESGREKKHRKEDERISESDERRRDRREKEDRRDRDSHSNRKRKHEEERSHKSRSSPSKHSNGHSSHTTQPTLWVKPHLRVRIVDDKYKKGKYYSVKVVVVDVSDIDHCVCKTDEGKVLSDVSPSMLETVVPRSDSSHVCIVTGKYRGQIGQVLERDKKKGEALVQLLSDRDKVLPLDYDSICEYVGNVDEEFDY